MHPEDARELDLIARIRAGGPADRAAWTEMVRLHQDRVFSTCMKMLRDRDAAADLTQDTFVKVIQGLDRYDGRSRLSTWLTRIAINACLSYLRSQKVRRHVSLDAGAEAAAQSLPKQAAVHAVTGGSDGRIRGGRGVDREQGPSARVESEDQRRRVAGALASLEPEHRAILILRDVQGLEYEQIAAVLEVAVGTVKSRLFRARLALRGALEGSGGEVPGASTARATGAQGEGS